MNLLIINYGTVRLESLTEICRKHQPIVIDGAGFSGLVDNSLDGVIVIGSLTIETLNFTDGHRAAVNLMQSGDMPVFGMGLGFELACLALGIKIGELAEKDHGAGKLVPTDDGAKIFQGSDPIVVKQTLRWCIDEMPRGAAVLARSDSGIEAIRSKSKPLYALQQLPDDFVYPSDGKLVIDNFLSLM